MDKFEKILDIIDHQEKYSDEEIREILQDEECRKLYQTMMEVDSALIRNVISDEYLVSLTYALFFVAIHASMGIWMYRKKIFIKL